MKTNIIRTISKRLVILISFVIYLCVLTLNPSNAQNIDLYGWETYDSGTPSDMNDDKLLYLKVNPITATTSVIDTVHEVRTIISGSFVHSNSQYLFYGNDSSWTGYKFLSIDTTGNVLTNIPLAVNPVLLEYQYDLNNQVIYALQYDTASNNLNLITLNPTNGIITIVNNTNFFATVGGASAFDSNNGRYIVYGVDSNNDIHLCAINVSDGTILSNPIVNYYLHELQFDVNTNKLYGIYNDTANYGVWLFAEIDLLTANATILDTLDGGPTSGSSTYDQTTGTYIYTAIVADTVQIEMSIYMINASNGQVISASPVFTNFIIQIECDNTAFAKSFYPTSIIEGKDVFNDLMIYPNPADNFFTIARNVTLPGTITLYDITGRMIMEQVLTDNDKTVSVSHLSEGLYIYNIQTGENKITRGKLVVE